MKQIMKLQRITQAAFLGAVIALPATLSAQDAVVEVQDNPTIFPPSGQQQSSPPSRSILVKESRVGGTYESGPAASNAIVESPLPQNLTPSRPGSIGMMGGRSKQVTLNNQLQQAVSTLQGAKTEAEKAGAKKLLKAELSQQFAADMKRRQSELQAIQQRVAKMEAMLQKRQDSKDEIVGLRLQTLVNNAEGLGWSTGPSYPLQSTGVSNQRPWPASPPQPEFFGGYVESRSTPAPQDPIPPIRRTTASPLAPAGDIGPGPAPSRDSFDSIPRPN